MAAIMFGAFCLLPTQRLLLEADEPVRLGSRALDILIALIERHGELVTKKDLMARVWPGITVVEANLAVHVSALRRALRDGKAGNRYLINIPGQGYRFVAPISITQELPPESSWVPAIEQDFDMRAMLARLIGSADEVRRLAAQLLEVSGSVG
ncbi:MAG TPA: transcriptional regulator [Roseiarcus sp.]|nr:transcriptional regulator [Roseiarcus sp.]